MSISGCSSAVGQAGMNTNIEKTANFSLLSIQIAKAIAYAYDHCPQLQKAGPCLELSCRED